jgi:hypothetical protein
MDTNCSHHHLLPAAACSTLAAAVNCLKQGSSLASPAPAAYPLGWFFPPDKVNILGGAALATAAKLGAALLLLGEGVPLQQAHQREDDAALSYDGPQ